MTALKVTFDELKEMGFVGVTDYCRYLVEHDYHIYGPHNTIEVYRGDRLCLKVNNIAKAAEIMAKDSHWIKYDKTRRKATQEPLGEV